MLFTYVQILLNLRTERRIFILYNIINILILSISFIHNLSHNNNKSNNNYYYYNDNSLLYEVQITKEICVIQNNTYTE